MLELGEVDPTDLGTPQGGPLSPCLANIYLHPLDVALQQMNAGILRYADDFVILARSQKKRSRDWQRPGDPGDFATAPAPREDPHRDPR